MIDIEQRSFYRPSRKMLEYLDNLSWQIIILRRHFWHIRDIINFLTQIQEDKPDIKYLKIVYDDINRLYDSNAHNGVVAAALFVFFKKKQWILVGELPVVKYERKDKKPMQH